MKTSKSIEKPKKDLRLNLQEKRRELRSLRFNLAAGRLKNNRKIREIKKEIARILTLINQSSVKEK